MSERRQYDVEKATFVLLSVTLISACVAEQGPAPSMSLQKEQVVGLLRYFETGAPELLSVINPEKYIQHNLGVADGLASLKALDELGKVSTVRLFQDCNYVFAHTDYGSEVGFDIFRFENDNIVEHWDNLQTKPTGLNPSGRSMLDGPTQPRNLEATAANKAVVRSYLREFQNRTLAAKYWDGDRYIQHNPLAADGLAATAKLLLSLPDTKVYTRIHQVLGEGNFVLVVSEGTWLGKISAYYDLFRMENGKFAEHWDVIEPIPERSEWKNNNGKF